jgi:hypothetical protein
MVAGILSHLGVQMGEHRNRADPFNQKGYYEDLRFINLHRAISGTVEEPFRHSHRLPAWDPQLNAEQLVLYRRLVETAGRTQGQLWGVKDPELTYYLPTFAGIAAELGITVKIVVPRRPLPAVIASLERKFNNPVERVERVVADYHARLELLINRWNGPLLQISYERCLDAPEAVVQRIAGFLEVPFRDEAAQFVTRSLRHFDARGSSTRLEHEPNVSVGAGDGEIVRTDKGVDDAGVMIAVPADRIPALH